MTKIYFLLLLVFSAQCTNAQNLALKIPADANAVATINAGKLSSLLPVEEWDKTSLGKMLGKLNQGKDSGTVAHSVKDLGINLNGTMYYFHTENDSMQYNCLLVPLTDGSKMEKILGKRELIRLANQVRKVTEDDSSAVFLWNDEQLLFVNAGLKDAWFSTKEIAERNGLSYNYYYNEPAVETDTSLLYSIDSAAAEIDSVSIVTDEAAVDSLMAIIKDNETSSDTTAEITDDYYTYEGSFDYYNDMAIKKRISAACASLTANEIFYSTAPTNILNNASYTASIKPEAIASLWVDKPMDLYLKLLPYSYMYGASPWNHTSGYDQMGYKSFTSHLTMNEKQMNIHSAIEMSGEIAAIQSKMMDRSINKQFYKYINTDSMLGYMSLAINTKNYLEAFPALMQKTYGSMGLGAGAEEYSLAAEFFSFLIDEEAIGNLIKGDMMLAFDGVFQQETTYTDYTYNDNFEQSAVEKTKTETIPRFLMMMSSKENNLARKLVKYGINKSIVKAKEGFYEMEIPRSPVHLYFMYKNDIFFLTNSLQNMQAISTGSFKSNISKNEKKLIRDHNMAMYIHPKNIAGKLVASGVAVTDELTKMVNAFNKMGAVRMKVNPIKNNIYSGDLWMEVPDGNSNALSLLLSFFDDMEK